MVDAHDLSVGVFVRGLTNLKAQLAKAAAHAAANGWGNAALLDARLPMEGPSHGAADDAPMDLHRFTLAAQVHWAAEGARLAVARLLDLPLARNTTVAASFAELHEHLDETIAYLRGIAPSDLDAGLSRTIVVEHRRGSTRASGQQFLLGYAIPHFLYHVTSAYSILRSQGVPLTMGDFLGNWARGSDG